MKPEELIRPEILALKAYHVAPAEGMVKLDAMENPYPLPAAMRRELAQVLSSVELHRYPDPGAAQLRELIRRKMGVPAAMELILGNGSDDLIQVVSLALARPGAAVMYPAPTFVMYSMNAVFSGLRAVPFPLGEDFALDAAAFIERMRAEKPALVFLAYPNNPTGVLYPEEDIVRIIEAASGVVVLDEAYHVFAGKTLLGRLPEFPNALVMRTVSKLGLAGIRLGYMAGAPEWIAQFNKVRQVYNVNVLTQAAAMFVLERMEVLEEQAARIRRDREALKEDLSKIEAIRVFPSAANFFLVRVPDAPRTYEALRRQGVLVRNVHPGIRDCLRITVGTPDENRILLTALREAL